MTLSKATVARATEKVIREFHAHAMLQFDAVLVAATAHYQSVAA